MNSIRISTRTPLGILLGTPLRMKHFALVVILCAFLCVFLSPNLLFAQKDPQNGTQSDSKFIVSGTVTEAENGALVPYAQVGLFSTGNTVPTTGMVTNDKGKFRLEAPAGTYRLEVVFVGFRKKIIENFNLQKNTDLGLIKLAADAEQMDAVVIEEEEIKTPIRATLSGLEIRPDQNMSNTGGSVLDVLRNTPSVRVSDDGAVSLRGSESTNVLIDGRNSALSSDLGQIPVSSIESIEIVNNPNAKYDAQAAGGVINIKLKKAGQLGTKVKAEVSYGTRNRFNPSVRLTHKGKKGDFYVGYSYRNWPSIRTGNTFRTSERDDEYFEQFRNSEFDDDEHTFNYGGSLYLGKNKITYEGVTSTKDREHIRMLRTRVADFDNTTLRTQYIRLNTRDEENFTMDNALIYERDFDDKERDFKLTVSNSFRDRDDWQDIGIFSDVFVTSEMPENPTNRERSYEDSRRRTSIVQADYSQPLLGGKFETGYKSTLRLFDRDFTYERLNSGEWINQEDVTNRFVYEEFVHAAYLMFGREYGKFKLNLGTRAEQTTILLTSYADNQTDRQDYLSFFPSLQAAYELDDKNLIKATYSRRIDRPGAFYLNPFPDVSDSLNVRVGDPTMRPEFINSFELGHMYEGDKFTLTSTAFYRHTKNWIDWIVRLEDGISFFGPRNLKSLDAYGVEFITTWEVFDWWNVNASYSLFGSYADGSNVSADFTNSGISWNAQMTTDFDLPFDFNLQFTGNYIAPEFEAQGRDLARYYLDINLQRSFFDKKIDASVSFRDIFDTRNFRGENFGEGFEQRFMFNRETQIILLSLAYSFDRMK